MTTSYFQDLSGILRHRENSLIAVRAGTEIEAQAVLMDQFYNTRTASDTVTVEIFLNDAAIETKTLS